MKWFYFAVVAAMVYSCTHSFDKKPEHSFYYWKTTFSSDSNDEKFVLRNNIDHFYIHYFDVDWNEQLSMPVPVAEITGFKNSALFTAKHYTPVIFITNRTFENFYWSDSFEYQIRKKIIFITNRINENIPQKIKSDNEKNITAFSKIDEIQIDCDWTPATQQKYFSFLKKLKSILPGKIISATIRLYPYKYPDKMGIPPVDKGLLMCYNLTDIKNSGTSNSIFDLKELKKYLSANPYPLPLDISLPVFGWYAWFSDHKFKGILYPGNKEGIRNSNGFLKNTDSIFTVLTDTMWGNNFLRQGDELRAEYPNPAELSEAAKFLKIKFPLTQRISFYYYNYTSAKRYETAIQNIYNIY